MMELKESPKYVWSFDESLNKKLQKGQMDILISWDSDKNIAIKQYINSEFMDGAKAEQILDMFLECTKNLDGKSLLQISSVGPNVNLEVWKMELKAPIGMLEKYWKQWTSY